MRWSNKVIANIKATVIWSQRYLSRTNRINNNPTKIKRGQKIDQISQEEFSLKKIAIPNQIPCG